LRASRIPKNSIGGDRDWSCLKLAENARTGTGELPISCCLKCVGPRHFSSPGAPGAGRFRRRSRLMESAVVRWHAARARRLGSWLPNICWPPATGGRCPCRLKLIRPRSRTKDLKPQPQTQTVPVHRAAMSDFVTILLKSAYCDRESSCRDAVVGGLVSKARV
jgi:hypothetical protein